LTSGSSRLAACGTRWPRALSNWVTLVINRRLFWRKD
jgi:hypothetical protein